MPSRQDEQKITVADRDRMIVELGHEIALNPKDATAYRKRGLLFGQNSHYDHAIADFDRVLALNPSDAGASRLKKPVRPFAGTDVAFCAPVLAGA